MVSAHDHLLQEKYRYENRKLSPDEAIAELNHRFREHGVGYQYESGMMMRVDSQIIHEEIVRPALSMLFDPMYEDANAEFLSAHEHYRTKKYKECLNDCLKAFESTIKAICTQRGWEFNVGDIAKRLIDIVFERKLIPSFMQAHFTALRSTFESVSRPFAIACQVTVREPRRRRCLNRLLHMRFI